MRSDGQMIQPTGYVEEAIELAKKEDRPITEEDFYRDPEKKKILSQYGVVRILALSLPVRERILGVLYVDSCNNTKEFSEQDRIFFYALTRQMAFALENARLYEENLEAKKKVEELNRELEIKFREQQEELEEVRDTLEVNLRELERRYTYHNIIGKSKAIQDIFDILDKISPTNLPVLITGESGTGKELIAKSLHYSSPRKDKPFISVNCAALPDSLLESELFGHKKGAFTGASQDKKGLFEMAHHGTLFLDEVGDMSLKMQRELLRVLQEGEIRPVGGRDVIKVNARIVAATNRNLQDMLQEGSFREDLYYRLNVIHIELPPLRERKEDILLLAEHFLQSVVREENLPPKRFAPESLKKLMEYSWPGNVRELRNFVERTALMSSNSVIGPDEILLDFSAKPLTETSLKDTTSLLVQELRAELHAAIREEILPELVAHQKKEQNTTVKKEDIWNQLLELPFQEAKQKFIELYLSELLKSTRYNITQAAEKAKILRSYLHKLIKKYNILEEE
ncbi:MAG: sigma-54-dependent Fis family transcriptional regulator [Planctomycetota bacterium]|nr:MAG: sigma-54-dependent Fis family transcriptional regulator [Planctomycetota bacterium]